MDIKKHRIFKRLLQKSSAETAEALYHRIYRFANKHRVDLEVAMFHLANTQYGIGINRELREKPEIRSALQQIALRSPPVVHAPNSRGSSPLKNATLRAKKIIPLVDYNTNDHFIKGHIHELNKAYTYGCNTSAFILARKIVENLIIDILKKKYPSKIDLYFDKNQTRLKDFGVILTNLKNKKNDFGTENKAVERLYGLSNALKANTNDKTHSWYHLVENKIEIDNLNLKAIIEIIKKLEQTVGIR